MIKAWVFYALWLLAVFFINIFSQSSGAFILLLVSVCLPALSLLIYAVFTPSVKANLLLPKTVKKGAVITARLQLKNKSLLPCSRLSFQLFCKNMLTSEEVLMPIKATLSSFASAEILLKVNTELCGKLSFSVNKVKAYSPFLLSFRRAEIKISETALILPSLKATSESLSVYFQNGGDGHCDCKKGTDMNETYCYREFTAGDLLKSIHPKLSQKLGKCMVKEGSKITSENAVVLFETSSFRKVLASECDAAAEEFFAVESMLVKKGIEHIAAWKNHDTGVYYTLEVKSDDDIAMLLPKLLSSPIKEDKKTAIDYYNQAFLQTESTQITIVSPVERKG